MATTKHTPGRSSVATPKSYRRSRGLADEAIGRTVDMALHSAYEAAAKAAAQANPRGRVETFNRAFWRHVANVAADRLN
jgi:hypothetical protein